MTILIIVAAAVAAIAYIMRLEWRISVCEWKIEMLAKRGPRLPDEDGYIEVTTEQRQQLREMVARECAK